MVAPWATQTPVELLAESALVYLLGSRYCETDLLSDIAWQHFATGPTGWRRVQAICDFVHRHIEFGYHHAHRTRTAWAAYNERRGVCRDYAHLAIIGRVLMAHGRDACDVALASTFGPNSLDSFEVWCDVVEA